MGNCKSSILSEDIIEIEGMLKEYEVPELTNSIENARYIRNCREDIYIVNPIMDLYINGDSFSLNVY